MKNKELYDLAESLLNPGLNALGFQHHAPPRASWLRRTGTRFLRLLIEVHHNQRWLPHSGGAFNCWMGFSDSTKQRVIAPEDSFSFDTLLDDAMLERRNEMRNRVIRKIISTACADELSRMLKTSSDELFLLEMQRGIHRNSGGQFRFHDAEDVKSGCALILELLPRIICEAETRVDSALANS